MGSWKGRGNQYIQFVRVLYCKLPTNGKQLPAFPLEAVPGTELRPQRWEARVLPLCHHGPSNVVLQHIKIYYPQYDKFDLNIWIYRPGYFLQQEGIEFITIYVFVFLFGSRITLILLVGCS